MAFRHLSLTLCQKGGTAMNQVKTFNHPLFGQVRTTVMTDGQIGFVGKDVAEALGYKDAPRLPRLDGEGTEIYS